MHWTVISLMALEQQKLITRAVLVIFGLVILLFVGIFVYSLLQQRKYNATALPSLEEEKVEDVTEKEESLFALDIIKNEPVSRGAYATRLDDEYAFQTVSVTDEEEALPNLEGAVETQEDYSSRANLLNDDDDDDFKPVLTQETLPAMPDSSPRRRFRMGDLGKVDDEYEGRRRAHDEMES